MLFLAVTCPLWTEAHRFSLWGSHPHIGCLPPNPDKNGVGWVQQIRLKCLGKGVGGRFSGLNSAVLTFEPTFFFRQSVHSQDFAKRELICIMKNQVVQMRDQPGIKGHVDSRMPATLCVASYRSLGYILSGSCP